MGLRILAWSLLLAALWAADLFGWQALHHASTRAPAFARFQNLDPSGPPDPVTFTVLRDPQAIWHPDYLGLTLQTHEDAQPAKI